jgi:Kef-type K+ transport system membrane component KefB
VFDAELFAEVLPGALFLFLALFIAQVSSAALAARYTGNFDWTNSMMIGFGMLGRAELAFVVMDIAYIDHQLISQEAFYTLMITAFFLNISVPLSIRWWKQKSGSDAFKTAPPL